MENKRCINSASDGERCTLRMGLKNQCHYHYNSSISSKGGPRKLTKSEVLKIIELYSSGLSANQVANKLGFSKPTVLRYARLSGVSRSYEQSNGSKYRTKPWVRKNKNYSTIEEYARKIITSIEYKEFRKEMFKRDRWTCTNCGYKGSKIQLDHIKPRCTHPELVFDENNVRTLCIECHKNTDTYGYKAVKLRKATT